MLKGDGVDVDEDLWWSRFVERLTIEAEERGGSVITETAYAQLVPPAGSSGEPVYLTRYDDGLCKMEVGIVTSFMANFVDFDDQNGILAHVLAVLGGHATESVDVSAGGEWIGVRSQIENIDFGGSAGSVRSHTPAPGQSGEFPAHTFSRRISGWGGLRFLSLKEAVAEGIADEEGNFLDPPGR